MTHEQLFTLRFNFQNMLRLSIHPYDYERIGDVLDIDTQEVREALEAFKNENINTAMSLKKEYNSNLFKNKEVNIVFAGDSVTSDRLSYMNILKEVFREHKNIALHDSSVSGWRSGDIVQEIYSYILLKKCDILVYAFGTNDVRTIKSEEYIQVTGEKEFLRNISYVIKCVKADKIILNTLAPVNQEKAQAAYGEIGWDFPIENWYKYNDIIRSVAKKENVYINDTQSIFEDCFAKGVDVFHDDGVHLNSAGQEIIARNLLKLLSNII